MTTNKTLIPIMVSITALLATALLAWYATGPAVPDGTATEANLPAASQRASPDRRAIPPGAVTSRWQPGVERVYSLSGQRTIEVAGQQGQGERVELALSGRWSVTVVAVSDDEVLLEMALRQPALDLRQNQTPAPATERSAALARLATPFYVRVSPSGLVQTIHLPVRASEATGIDAPGEPGDPDSSDMFATSLLQSIVAATQYVTGDGDDSDDSWDTEEADTTGVRACRYQQLADDRIQKTDLGYVRIASAAGMVPLEHIGSIESDGVSHFALGTHGAPEHIDGRDQLHMTMAQHGIAIASRSTWNLELDGTYTRALPRLDDLPDLDGAGWRSFALADGDLSRRQGQSQDRQRLDGASFATLLAELERAVADDDGMGRTRSMQRWAALMRLEPDTAGRIPAVVAASEHPLVGGVLIGALESADTSEAQAALREIAGSSEMARDHRIDSLAALGSLSAPDATTVALLRATMAKNPLDSASPEALASDPELQTAVALHSTAALALGAIAGQAGQNDNDNGRDSDPGASGDIVDELLQQLADASSPDQRALYLEALGNTRDPRVIPAVQRWLTSEWPHVRGAATRALRFFGSPEIDRLLLAVLLQDSNVRVRADVLFAFSHRPLAPLVAALRPFLAGEQVAGLRKDAIELIGSNLPELAQLTGPVQSDALAALDWAATSDSDPDVREAALSYLQ